MSYVSGNGRKVVTSAGTDEALGGNVPCEEVIVTAETDNTGVIAVGVEGVIASLSTRTGVPLAAGASVTVATNNLNKIWIDSTVSGDGVTYLYTGVNL